MPVVGLQRCNMMLLGPKNIYKTLIYLLYVSKGPFDPFRHQDLGVAAVSASTILYISRSFSEISGPAGS